MKKLISLIAVLSLWISLGMAQTTVKLKKDGTPDKRYATSKDIKKEPAVKLKKDGTPDMRYSTKKAVKEAPAAAVKEAPAVAKEVKAKPVTRTNTAVKSAAAAKSTKTYQPTVDRSKSGPNGEEILTGPRGGKYYINKNGNKTYVKRDN